MGCGTGTIPPLIQPRDAEDTRYKIWRNELANELASQPLREGTQQKPSASPPVIRQQDAVSHIGPSLERQESSPATSQEQRAHAPLFDFIISYADADLADAEWVASSLEQAGYSTMVRAWDFEPGANYITEMEEATSQAKRTLVILTPHYLQEFANHSDWKMALFQDIAERTQADTSVCSRSGNSRRTLGTDCPD